MSNVKLIGLTKIVDPELLEELKDHSPEELIMYCARVSNPANQTSGNTGLLRYCTKHNHVSIFEMAHMIMEIKTSRAISAQILRHRSFSFQEFSQRYAKTQSYEVYDARRQDLKNRQNSLDDMSDDDKVWFTAAQKIMHNNTMSVYQEALDRGVAKEQARFLLPMSSSTTMYMAGSIRSWVHYLNVRCQEDTQLEHRVIANDIKEIFCREFPTIAEALDWIK